MTEHRQTTRPEDGDPLEEAAWEAAMNGGWAGYEEGPPPPRTSAGPLNLSVLFVLVDALRAALPGAARERFTSLVREVLLTLRSLIDWYLERLEDGRRRPRVEDIPLE